MAGVANLRDCRTQGWHGWSYVRGHMGQEVWWNSHSSATPPLSLYEILCICLWRKVLMPILARNLCPSGQESTSTKMWQQMSLIQFSQRIYLLLPKIKILPHYKDSSVVKHFWTPFPLFPRHGVSCVHCRRADWHMETLRVKGIWHCHTAHLLVHVPGRPSGAFSTASLFC